jgi:pyruvate,water dikinase
MDVLQAEQAEPSISVDEVLALADIARKVEKVFGSAVDMEWAVGLNSERQRTIYLLQARPETVWASKPRNILGSSKAEPSSELGSLDEWDNLHSFSEPHLHWSTSNFGEAIPGVSTPLSWSIWGAALESAMRGSVYAIGAFDANEKLLPKSSNEWFARSFFGRPAMNVKYLAMVGDRMPGTTGQAVVRDLLGEVPEDMQFRHTMRRYPSIAWRLPWTFFTTPGKVRRVAAETNEFWLANTTSVKSADHAAAIKMMVDTVGKFRDAVTLQATLLLGSISPLYDAIAGLVKKTGIGDTAALSGFGGAEMDVIGDIFRAAHGDLRIEDVVRRHGFHGPMEGELSSIVWREDASPLRKLLADYAVRDDSADPHRQAEKRRKDAIQTESKLLAALPFHQRPVVRLLLRLAAKRIPMRGIPKRSFLQLFDVLRVCARRIGELLAAEGKLDRPDDVFYLTIEELCVKWPDNAPDLIVKRRRRRATYTEVSVPTQWQGMPQAIHQNASDRRDESFIKGIGVSPGIIEGRARVLLSPDFAEVTAGEILVTPTTDPSWSSVMFISAGLVVDIGGALSHAAIVARELGLPCVVNTKNGSQVVRSGDLLRVDGAKGLVEIIERREPITTKGELATAATPA